MKAARRERDGPLRYISERLRPFSKGLTALIMSGDQSAELFLTQILPGTSKQFSLVYDAPASATGLWLRIPGGFSSRMGTRLSRCRKKN